MLRAVNQSGLMFNSAKARVLGPASTWAPEGEECSAELTIVPYSTPPPACGCAEDGYAFCLDPLDIRPPAPSPPPGDGASPPISMLSAVTTCGASGGGGCGGQWRWR